MRNVIERLNNVPIRLSLQGCRKLGEAGQLRERRSPGNNEFGCSFRLGVAPKLHSDIETAGACLSSSGITSVLSERPFKSADQKTERGKLLNPEYNIFRDQPTSRASPLRINTLLSRELINQASSLSRHPSCQRRSRPIGTS